MLPLSIEMRPTVDWVMSVTVELKVQEGAIQVRPNVLKLGKSEIFGGRSSTNILNSWERLFPTLSVHVMVFVVV